MPQTARYAGPHGMAPGRTPDEGSGAEERRGVGVNHVTLVGRLTADPETGETKAGTRTRLRVATNERAEPEFHDVTLWGSLGQVAAAHLRRGRLVYLEGRVHNSSWTAADGTARRGYEVIGETLQFLDSPGVAV